MLKSIFYARFHTERGPCVLHEYPIRSIIPSADTDKPLLSWPSIRSHIIPPYDVCNHPLSICTDGHRVLALPVSIGNNKYERNCFTFNVGFVLSEQDDISPWEPIVRKTADFFQALEEESDLLTAEESLPDLPWTGTPDYPAKNIGTIFPLLQAIFERLNTYGECSIHVDDIHVLNLRLFTPRASNPPPKVQAWDVPLLIRPLPEAHEWTWDLTLRRIHPHIDGIRHVQSISELADAELKLVKRAIAELLMHNRALLLDLFHFQAIYACTSSFTHLVTDPSLQTECLNYILLPSPPPSSSRPSPAAVLALYASLQPGSNLSAFCTTHRHALAAIDIRRFITFGVIKGFLKRIHRYALALEPQRHSHPAAAAAAAAAAAVGATTAHASTSASSSSAIAAATSLPTPPSLITRDRAGKMAGDGEGGGGGRKREGESGGRESGVGGVEEVSRSLEDGSTADTIATATTATAARDFDRAWKKAALSSGWATPPSGPPLGGSLGRSYKSREQVRSEEDEVLGGFLDGRHCLDQICVEMHLSERKVVERLRSGRFGEVVLFCK